MMDVEVILSIGSFALALVAAVIAIRKAPAEVKATEATVKKVDAEEDQIYQEIAAGYALEVRELREELGKIRREGDVERKALTAEIEMAKETSRREIQSAKEAARQEINVIRLQATADRQQLEREISTLRSELQELRRENECLVEENGDLREWAERLVKQVIQLKGTPVKIRRRGNDGGAQTHQPANA